MVLARTLACALLFSFLPLLAGCGRPSEQRVEDLEPESIRQERRMRQQKLMPKDARPADAEAQKK